MAAEATGSDTSADAAVPVAALAELPGPHFGWALLWALLPLVAQVAVGIGAGVLAFAVLLIVTQSQEAVVRYESQLQLLQFSLGTLTTLLLALAVCGLLFGRSFARVVAWRGCTLSQWLLVLMWVLPLGILVSEWTNWVEEVVRALQWGWLNVFREAVSSAFAELSEVPFLAVFVAGCLLPGLGEELYCRGFLSRGLVARHGVVAGTLAASFLFGAMHIEPVQAMGAMLMGVGLQFVFLATRSLPAAVALHTLNNVLAFLAMRHANAVPIPGVTPPADGGVTHTPPLLLLAAAAAAVLIGWQLWRVRTRWVLPSGAEWQPGYVTAEMPPAVLQARAESARLGWLAVSSSLVAYAGLLAALLASQGA